MEWVKIFSSADEARARLQAGKPQLLVVHGKRICLVWHQQDFLAVQDSCTHHGGELSQGHVNYLGEIICPWHNFRFDLKTGRATDSSCADLKTYPVKTDDSGFFIGI